MAARLASSRRAGATGDPRRQPSHAQAGAEAADGQRGQAEPGEPEAQGGAGQDAVGHSVTDQAHAPQDEEYAQRRGAACQHQPADQGAAHKDEVGEGHPQVGGEVHQATCIWGCGRISSLLAPNMQPVFLICSTWWVCWRTDARSWQTMTSVRPWSCQA